MRETILQTPRSVKKEGRTCSRCWSRDSPEAHGEDHCEAGCPPAAQEGAHARAGGCLKEAVTPWEARAGADSWQDLWSDEPVEQVFWQDL